MDEEERREEIVSMIRDKEYEIVQLKKEYSLITRPCANTDCEFYAPKDELSCSWTDLVTTCNDYKEE